MGIGGRDRADSGAHRDEVEAYVAAVHDLAAVALRSDRATAEAMRRAEPPLDEHLGRVTHELKLLVGDFNRKYGASYRLKPVEEIVRGALGASPRPVMRWAEGAASVRRQMNGTKMPFLRSKLLEQQARHSQWVTEVVDSAPSAAAAVIDDGFRRTTTMAAKAGNHVVDAMAPDIAAAAAVVATRSRLVAPPHGQFADPRWASWDGEPSAGRLAFQVGSVTPSSVEVAVWPRAARSGHWFPGSPTSGKEVVTVTPTHLELPVILDLDLHRGVYTYDHDIVRGVVLKALAAIPGGRFTAAVFDPRRLGDSVSFLFGLGDNAERVIGLKVRSTERELAELLTELEEHLTFVTQKYLQGQFESLTDYNRAAGEIAEPYRALVLFDYPHGFVRGGGHVDEQLVARLEKIVGAGPRCGVYPLVALADPAPTVATADVWHAIAPLAFVDKATQLPQWARMLSQLSREADLAPGAGEKDVAPSLTWDDVKRRRNVFVGGTAAVWRFSAEPFPHEAAVSRVIQAVERRLVAVEDVRVGRDRVLALHAGREHRAAARDGHTPPPAVLAGDPATWWHRSSVDDVEVPFGRLGASDVALLRLDSRTLSSGLVGGRPGAGKSVLFHSFILGLCTLYAPTEVELFLVDFKEGVEFKVYAEYRLPHARVVAIESDREFGLSVLEALSAEIERRGGLFRGTGGGDVNLATYRRSTGRTLPRQVLVVDEFHVLFERDDRIAARSAELLDRIIRQGRAFGIHTILGSQTLGGSAALGRHTLNQVPVRVALQCSDADSRLLLADDNADARLLTRPGEGILNVVGGRKEGNQRFQTAWVGPEEREAAVRQLRQKADDHGMTARPVVFEGNLPASVEEADAAALHALAVANHREPQLALGLPLALAGPVTWRLRRAAGSNLLVVADEDDAAALATVVVALAVVASMRVSVLDFLAVDNALEVALRPLVAADRVCAFRRRGALDELERVHKSMVERRDLDDLHAQGHLVVVSGLHRARDLQPSYDDADPASRLEAVLSDGPDLGIHVLATCDRVVSLDRRLSRGGLREFALRVAFRMAADDSIALLDSDIATQLNGSQAVLDDQDEVVTRKFRPWRMITAAELTTLSDVATSEPDPADPSAT